MWYILFGHVNLSHLFSVTDVRTFFFVCLLPFGNDCAVKQLGYEYYVENGQCDIGGNE